MIREKNMFKKIMRSIMNINSNRPSFDPASFNDSLALKTSWTPAKRGGTNFRTHKLVIIDPNRLEFKASIGAKLFYLLFPLVGIGILIFFPFPGLSSGEFSFNIDTIIPLLFGLAFIVAGVSLFYFGTTPIVFDKRSGFFWKGRKSPDNIINPNSLKHFTDLDQIHALQLISEYCRGNKSSYYSYELNLVLEDGNRIVVVDHGNRTGLRDDAGALSDFLDKPVWDAI